MDEDAAILIAKAVAAKEIETGWYYEVGEIVHLDLNGREYGFVMEAPLRAYTDAFAEAKRQGGRNGRR